MRYKKLRKNNLLKSKLGAETLTMNKLVMLLLVLLVVALILMFIFKGQILSWIKNLPGFEQQPDEERILTKDELKQLGYDTEFPIGKIILEEREGGNSGAESYIDIGDIKTRMYVNGEASNGEIKLAKGWFDIDIGDINSYVITIKPELLTEQGWNNFYNENGKRTAYLPLRDTLIKLNNARIDKTNNNLLKKKEA